MAVRELNQIPQILVEILKDSDGAIGGVLRLANEPDASLDHGGVIPLKVIGLKEQEDAAASLISDKSLLMGRGRPRQKQRRRTVAWRADDHPALVLLRL
jgi:hypothetical protein